MRTTPKQKLSHAGARPSIPPLPAKITRQYDKLMGQAFEKLDSDDYDGFWAHIEDMNDLVREARDA